MTTALSSLSLTIGHQTARFSIHVIIFCGMCQKAMSERAELHLCNTLDCEWRMGSLGQYILFERDFEIASRKMVGTSNDVCKDECVHRRMCVKMTFVDIIKAFVNQVHLNCKYKTIPWTKLRVNMLARSISFYSLHNRINKYFQITGLLPWGYPSVLQAYTSIYFWSRSKGSLFLGTLYIKVLVIKK